MNKFCVGLLLFFGGIFVVKAQEPITLKWKLVDENLQPLSYATVMKNDTSLWVFSDDQGNFAIKVVPEKDTLIISYLAFERLKIPISSVTPKESTQVMIKAEIDLCYEGVIFQREQINGSLENETLNDAQPLGTSINSKAQTRVSPNPTPNLIFLQQNSALGMVELYNLSRQKLQSFNFGEQLNASIDLSALPAGTYFLRSNQGWVEKVILQK